MVDSTESTDLLTKSLEPINESVKRIPICYNAANLFYSGNRNILITKTHTNIKIYIFTIKIQKDLVKLSLICTKARVKLVAVLCL